MHSREYTDLSKRRDNMKKDLVKIFKALADQSRLLIINSLIERDMYVEALTESLGLSPSTVSFHLKKLEQAGLVNSRKDQYYVVYSVNREILDRRIIEFIKIEDVEKEAQEQRLNDYRNKVINAFMQYGKLKSIPVQRKKRRIILEELAKEFVTGRKYTEKEVSEILGRFNEDFAFLRREMVGEGIFKRENGIYELIIEE